MFCLLTSDYHHQYWVASSKLVLALKLFLILSFQLRKGIFEINTVKYVKLATHEDKPIQEACKEAITMGWGLQYAQNAQGDPLKYPLPYHDPYLQCMKTSVVSNSDCVKRLEVDKMITDTFCAFTKDKDPCQVK